MSQVIDNLTQALSSISDEDGFELIEDRNELTLIVPAESLLTTCKTLRDSEALSFEILIDHCGVDYSAFGKTNWDTSETATNTGFSRGVNDDLKIDEETENRFAVVIHLLSIKHNHRLRVKSFAHGEPPRAASVVDVWNSANWFERETFDMFGILFDGHPDLRRILTDYGFIGHPLRKDFPISGHVEMRYDEDRKRVIYQPVSIDPRTLVPRTIRDDHRYHAEQGGDNNDA